MGSTTKTKPFVTLSRDALVEALAYAVESVAAKSHRPELTFLRLTTDVSEGSSIGTLTIETSNGDQTREIVIPVDAPVAASMHVPAQVLSQILAKMPARADVSLIHEDPYLTVQVGRIEFELKLAPVQQGFAGVPRPADDDPSFTIGGAELASALSTVVQCAEKEASSIIGGVRLLADGKQLELVATDKYRMSWDVVPGASGTAFDMPVPKIAVAAAGKFAGKLGGTVKVSLVGDEGREQVVFDFGDRRLSTTLVPGKFPDHVRLFDIAVQSILTVSTVELINAVDRMSVIPRAAGQPPEVELEVVADAVTVVPVQTELGRSKERIAATATGADVTLRFNADYLLAGLAAVKHLDTVEIHLQGAGRPALIADRDFKYLLVPMARR